jgi:hypothetical protein
VVGVRKVRGTQTVRKYPSPDVDGRHSSPRERSLGEGVVSKSLEIAVNVHVFNVQERTRFTLKIRHASGDLRRRPGGMLEGEVILIVRDQTDLV